MATKKEARKNVLKEMLAKRFGKKGEAGETKAHEASEKKD